MDHFTYVILGGGMTADAAARGIRELDSEGSIAIVSSDQDAPYTRPALSKRLWTDPDFTEQDNYLGTEDATGATLMLGTEARSFDPEAKTVDTSAGALGYDRLLLATGASPNTIDLEEGERVIYFRTFADYRRLRDLASTGAEVAVIGGGFIGTELAAALVQNGAETSLIFDDEHLAASVFPADLARDFHRLYEDHGVRLIPGTKAGGGRLDGDRVVLEYDGGSVSVDAVVVGLGVKPRVDLAEAAGAEVDDGILVDESLRTSLPDVYASGDVASYPDAILGRQRVEHVDNAKTMGAVAGRIMAGSHETYTHTPYFYTNVFDFNYRAVGDLDSSLRTLEDWTTPQQKGAVFYLSDDDRVRGVLLVDLEGGLETARQILAEDRPHDRSELVGRLTG